MTVTLHYWPSGLRHARRTDHADAAEAVRSCPRLAAGTCAIVSAKDEEYVERPNEWYVGDDRLFATDAARPELLEGARRAKLGKGPARWVLRPVPRPVPSLLTVEGPKSADAVPDIVTAPVKAPRRGRPPKAKPQVVEGAAAPTEEHPAHVLDYPLSRIRLPKPVRDRVLKLNLVTIRQALAMPAAEFGRRAPKGSGDLGAILRTHIAQDAVRIRLRHDAAAEKAREDLATAVERIRGLSRAERISECEGRPLADSVRLGIGFHGGDHGALLLSVSGLDGKGRTIPALADELGLTPADVERILAEVVRTGEEQVGWPSVLARRLREECGDARQAVLPAFANRGWYQGLTWGGLGPLARLALGCIRDTGLKVSVEGLRVERTEGVREPPKPSLPPCRIGSDELPFDDLVGHVPREASIDEGLPVAIPAAGSASPASPEDLPPVETPADASGMEEEPTGPDRPFHWPDRNPADDTGPDATAPANAAVVFMRWPARATRAQAAELLAGASRAMTGSGSLFLLLDDESAGLFGRYGIGDHLFEAGLHMVSDINWMRASPPGVRFQERRPERFKPPPPRSAITRLASTGGRVLHVARKDALPADLRDPDAVHSGIDGANSNGMSRNWFVRDDGGRVPEVLYAMCLHMVGAHVRTIVVDAVGDDRIPKAALRSGAQCRGMPAPTGTVREDA